MNEKFEFTDRYRAMGIAYPDPETCCDGQCEGTGLVPVYLREGVLDQGDILSCVPVEIEDDEELIRRWRVTHSKWCLLSKWGRIRLFCVDWRKAFRFGLKNHWHVCFDKCDGWHFVKCPVCNGTGKK